MIRRVTKNRKLLSVVCSPVEDMGTTEVNSCIIDLIDTLESKRACGLAANQIGYTCRIFAVKTCLKAHVFINPQILDICGAKINRIEKCLSYSRGRLVARQSIVKCTYTTEYGATKTRWFIGRKARVIQHELEHLDGFIPDSASLIY